MNRSSIIDGDSISLANQEYFINLLICVVDSRTELNTDTSKNLIDLDQLALLPNISTENTDVNASISKKIVEKMGGSVVTAWQPQKGFEYQINFRTKCRVIPTKLLIEKAADEDDSPCFLCRNPNNIFRKIDMEKVDFENDQFDFCVQNEAGELSLLVECSQVEAI